MRVVKSLLAGALVIVMFCGVSYAAIYDLARRNDPANSQDADWYVVDLKEGETVVSTWACVDDTDYWLNLTHPGAVSLVSDLNSWNWDNKTWSLATSAETVSALLDTFEDDPDTFLSASGFDLTYDHAGTTGIWGWNSDMSGSDYYTHYFEWDGFLTSHDYDPRAPAYQNTELSVWVYSSGAPPVPEFPCGMMSILALLAICGSGWIKRFVVCRACCETR
ncbi:MAG: hypothetical protein KAS86_00240 [Candidatus Omnitrophica bacterium]|nr:hypothetical protein [Candidatus Omnitrophota bacterium]